MTKRMPPADWLWRHVALFSYVATLVSASGLLFLDFPAAASHLLPTHGEGVPLPRALLRPLDGE